MLIEAGKDNDDVEVGIVVKDKDAKAKKDNDEKPAKKDGKKKMNGFKEFNPNKYIEVNPTINEAAGEKSIVITFGRMNPPTTGHSKLVRMVTKTARRNKADAAVYLSHSQDKKKNPLSYEDKIKATTYAFGSIVKKSDARTIIEVLKELDGTYSNVIIVVGSDRVQEFDTLANKYNGSDYTFKSIKVVSAGDRDPDAEGVEGMSASKMRQLAKDGEVASFIAGLPDQLARQRTRGRAVYDLVRKEMGIREENKMLSFKQLSEAKKMKGDDPCWDSHEMIGTKKKNGKEVPNCVPKEEVDEKDVVEAQLDELSPKTLGSYVKKAKDDMRINTRIAGDFKDMAKRARKYNSKAGAERAERDFNKRVYKRSKNIDKAVDRLTREEVELNEKDKSGSYKISGKRVDLKMLGLRKWLASVDGKEIGEFDTEKGAMQAATKKIHVKEDVYTSFLDEDNELIGFLNEETCSCCGNEIVDGECGCDDDCEHCGGKMKEALEFYEALNMQQRRAIARRMKRLAPRIARAKRIQMRKKATIDKLQKRAYRQARLALKKKFAGGKDYKTLSVAARMRVDDRVKKIPAQRLSAMSRKLLPSVRKRENERYANMQKGNTASANTLKPTKKNEEVLSFKQISEASFKDQKVMQRPHMLLKQDNSVKFDGRFKQYKKWKDQTPSDIKEEFKMLSEMMEGVKGGTAEDRKILSMIATAQNMDQAISMVVKARKVDQKKAKEMVQSAIRSAFFT